ncbi:type II toxin-antitoxin system VapC family toxin [Fortiea sp. LEGE XX443]|uniref:type II toxin-antitoxin system VapC family toxin n=1 Tax=Fortiea sp. LEGE XX443 TaxID=1828611 RepID=UPI00187EE856|nr:type II toxin-antitoxin system VapC family toxin [Fortiea sp. LEGE XX443]MBE9005151.1 type II toxin-antitoxin system VapC family toxin [Fortiea sp. LEGE XX443]
MSYLVDTNILLRLVQKNSPMHPETQRAIFRLKQQSELLYIVPQNIIEFWAVCTRPINSNALGLSITEAVQASNNLKKIFILQVDIPAIFHEWESLIIKHQVIGKKVHDTRLVAAMVVHNITHLLTFNVDDFKRFSEIIVVDPCSVKS